MDTLWVFGDYPLRGFDRQVQKAQEVNRRQGHPVTRVQESPLNRVGNPGVNPDGYGEVSEVGEVLCLLSQLMHLTLPGSKANLQLLTWVNSVNFVGFEWRPPVVKNKLITGLLYKAFGKDLGISRLAEQAELSVTRLGLWRLMYHS